MAHKRLFLSPHAFLETGAINGRKQANAGFLAALLELDPFDEYHFFVADPQALREAWKGLGQVRAVRRGALRAGERMRLPEALRERAYAVCHFSDPVNGLVPMAMARNRFARDIFPITAPNHTFSYTSMAADLRSLIWEGWSPRDALGCNSTAARDALRAYLAAMGGGEGRMPRLEVVPMGAFPREPARDAVRRAAMRRRLGVGGQGVLLLLFGRLSVADKLDPQPLVLALRRVLVRRPDLELHLVISGARVDEDPSPEILEVLARHFRLSLRVWPNPEPEDKEALFAAADIFVSPSDNIQETFGLVLAEAMAAGLPVIAADWDGYRDIVRHGETGLLVPTATRLDTPQLDLQAHFMPAIMHHFLRAQSTCVDVPALADAVLALAADPALRRRLGAAGRERAARCFSWKVVAERWAALWERLAAAPLDAAAEEALRACRHPLNVPFGRVFAGFATGGLAADALYACTDVGRMLLQGALPWETVSFFEQALERDALRRLLVCARRPAGLEALRRKCGGDAEAFEGRVLFCLKHDLLERRSPPR